MNTSEYILLNSFKEALIKLKEGYTLFSVNNKVVSYFALVNETVRVKSANAFYVIKVEELADLFKDNKFYIYEAIEDVEISKEKDDEYYSWKQ